MHLKISPLAHFCLSLGLLQQNLLLALHGAPQGGLVNYFASQLIQKHFDDCYIIKMRKTASSEFANTNLRSPVIDINLNQPDYLQVVTHFRESPRYSLMIKHHRQCIVYYISLVDFLAEDVRNLLQVFEIESLQIEATFSYMIVSEFNNYETAAAFTTSKTLQSFQHRLWVEADKQNSSTDIIKLQIRNFCFFCFNGNAGMTQPGKKYKLAQEVQTIEEIFPDMTRNFHGKVMRVVAPPAPPLVVITPSKTNPGKNDIQGQHANILFSLSHHFNFTYSLYTSPGGLTGIKLPNGTWNGIMGEILYDRADIGISVATSHERYQIVDVTVSVFYAFLVLVSTKPQPFFDWEAIFYPFELNCWLAFIASTVFTFYASKWLHNNAIKYEIPALMKGKSQSEILIRLKSQLMTNYKSFYVTVGQLLEQGTPFDFNATPSRMYILFWMFFAMIITTAYRSKLFTFLTFPQVEIPPSSWTELAESSYKWGMKHLGGIAFVFITKSPLPYIRYVGEKMVVYNDKYSCLDRTFNDRFTCIIYKAYIDYMIEVRYWKIRHKFYISDFVTPPVGSSWVLPKYAPWLPAFDRVSYPIYEMGLADKYLYDYQVDIAKVLRAQAEASNSTQDIFELNSNYQGDNDGPKPLIMDNLYAAFFILMFGATIAALAFMFETFKCDENVGRRKNELNQKLRNDEPKHINLNDKRPLHPRIKVIRVISQISDL